jgi:hypothetical protein
LFPWIVLLVVAIVVDGDTEEIDRRRRPRGMDPPHKEGAAGGAAEVTSRINVIYFMSRGGRTDRPHLFRVNHHSRAGGVRLRGTCPPSSIEFVRSSFLRAPFVRTVDATVGRISCRFPGRDQMSRGGSRRFEARTCPKISGGLTEGRMRRDHGC